VRQRPRDVYRLPDDGPGEALFIGLIVVVDPWPKPQHAANNERDDERDTYFEHDECPRRTSTILPAMGFADQCVSSANGASRVGRGICATEVVIAQAGAPPDVPVARVALEAERVGPASRPCFPPYRRSPCASSPRPSSPLSPRRSFCRLAASPMPWSDDGRDSLPVSNKSFARPTGFVELGSLTKSKPLICQESLRGRNTDRCLQLPNLTRMLHSAAPALPTLGGHPFGWHRENALVGLVAPGVVVGFLQHQ
jgi:hypothetical protein